MHKRLLSVVLTLALLAGALSCGLLLPGSADTPKPTKTDKDGYHLWTFADKDTTYVDYLNEVLARPNAMVGVTPKVYPSVTADGAISGDAAGQYHQYCPNTNAKFFSDGLIPGINAAIDNGTTTNKKVFWSSNTYPYLYVDLGCTATIDQIVIAAATGEGTMGEVKIYVGNDPATLVSDTNLVATESGFFGAVLDLDTAISVRYVAIKGSGSITRISELGLYMNAPLSFDRDTYTVMEANSASYGAYLSALMTDNTNLLKSAAPKTYADADFVNGTAKGFHAGSNTGSYLVDDNIPAITDTVGNSNHKVFWQTGVTPYLYYDLGGTANLKQLLLASSHPENTKYGNKLGEITVYMGNDPATLVSDTNLVASETVKSVSIITLDNAVSARYVAIWFGGDGGYARVSELALYTQDNAPIVTPPVITDKGTYTETAVTTSAQANSLTAFLSLKNVINGTTAAVYANGDFINGTPAAVQTDSGYSVSEMTDGIIPGITNNDTNAKHKVFWQCKNNPYLFYDLGGTATIDHVLLAGSQPEYKQYNTSLGEVKVYVGDDPATLVSDANLVAQSAVDVVSVFSFKTAVKGRYIAIWFGGSGNYARVSELGIYGIAPDGMDKGDYIVNTYADGTDIDKLTGVMSLTNVIDVLPTAVYKTTAFTTDTPGSIMNYNTSMTDGAIPGITRPVSDEDKANSNIYKGHWNSSTYPYLYYDLKGEATISHIVLAGSVPEGKGLGSVRVYMGDDPATLVSDANLVVEENVGYASLLTLKTPKKVKYVAVQFLAPYARVSELGFYSPDGYAQPIAPNGTKITVTNINSPADKAKLETFTNQANWLGLAGATRPTVHAEIPLKESVTNPNVEGGDEKVIADNKVPGISNDEDSSKQKIYWTVSNGSYLLFDIGIVCKEIRHVLLAASYTELIQYGSSLGEVKLYIGNDMATLIQDANCYADLAISACSVITLPESIDARYVAFWFGGNGGYVRLSEVGVYCDYVPEVLSLPTEFTADSPVGEGKVSVKIARNLSDLYDATLLKSIRGVRLVEKDMPQDMPKSIDNGWLSPKGDKMYSLELYDKDGKAVTFEDAHRIIARIPNMDAEVNTMGIYKDGELTRPWNIIPTADRKTMFVGQDFGNEGTLYYTESMNLVFMRFNTPDEVRELTAKKEYPHFSLNYTDGKAVATY